MTAKQTPRKDVLEELLLPDFDAGRIFWKPRPLSFFTSDRIHRAWNARFASKEAFTSVDANGYFYGRILEGRFFRHRILWKMAYGYDAVEIDHINRTPLDNRIANLRASTRSENNINRRLSDYNTTGHVGIYRQADATGHSWVAQIKRGGSAVHLGRFPSIEEAIAARSGAERALEFFGK